MPLKDAIMEHLTPTHTKHRHLCVFIDNTIIQLHLCPLLTPLRCYVPSSNSDAVIWNWYLLIHYLWLETAFKEYRHINENRWEWTATHWRWSQVGIAAVNDSLIEIQLIAERSLSARTTAFRNSPILSTADCKRKSNQRSIVYLISGKHARLM